MFSLRGRFSFRSNEHFLADVRGILISCNLILNCILCSGSGNSFYLRQVETIINHLQQLKIKIYMTEIDFHITHTYLRILKDRMSQKDYILLANILKECISECPVNEEVQECIIELRETLRHLPHPPDTVRLAAACSHDLAIVTWEPRHYAGHIEEENELDRQRYFFKRIAYSYNLESPGLDEFASEQLIAGIWIFAAESFYSFLDNVIRENAFSQISSSDNALYFDEYSLESNVYHASCKVKLRSQNGELEASQSSAGPIDALLGAIKQAALPCTEHLPPYDLTFSVMDKWETSNGLTISTVTISCRIGDSIYRNTQEDINILVAVGRAYVGVLNLMIQNSSL